MRGGAARQFEETSFRSAVRQGGGRTMRRKCRRDVRLWASRFEGAEASGEEGEELEVEARAFRYLSKSPPPALWFRWHPFAECTAPANEARAVHGDVAVSFQPGVPAVLAFEASREMDARPAVLPRRHAARKPFGCCPRGEAERGAPRLEDPSSRTGVAAEALGQRVGARAQFHARRHRASAKSADARLRATTGKSARERRLRTTSALVELRVVEPKILRRTRGSIENLVRLFAATLAADDDGARGPRRRGESPLPRRRARPPRRSRAARRVHA